MGFDIIENRRRIIMNAPHIATASGTIATFETDMSTPIAYCLLRMEPKQAGGDPSPTHILPISGYTGVTYYVSPTEYEGDGSTHVVDWQSIAGTVYGGVYDAISGILTMTMAMVDLGTFTWRYRGELSSSNIFTAIMPFKTNKSNFKCDKYKTIDNSLYVSSMPDKSIKGYTGTESDVIYIRDMDHRSTDTFNPAIAGTKLVYELDTPVIFQLDPEALVAMRGTNNIWMDAAGVVDARYWTR